jgi:hypothetical protein
VRPNIGTVAGDAWVWDDSAYLPWEVRYSANYSALELPRDQDLDDCRLPTGVAIKVLEPGQRYGAALDVYVGEFEYEPDPRLWDDERVLITPRIAGGNDVRQHRGINLFCDNLRAYLDGRPLTNVIDWAAGY